MAMALMTRSSALLLRTLPPEQMQASHTSFLVAMYPRVGWHWTIFLFRTLLWRPPQGSAYWAQPAVILVATPSARPGMLITTALRMLLLARKGPVLLVLLAQAYPTSYLEKTLRPLAVYPLVTFNLPQEPIYLILLSVFAFWVLIQPMPMVFA